MASSPLEWSEIYRTGLPRVDDQHQEIFRLIRAVSDSKVESILDVFTFLVRHVATHFEDEERYMRASGYPEIVAHQWEHEALTRKVGEMYRGFIDGRPEMGSEVALFLSVQIPRHIIQTDIPFVQWVKSRWGDLPMPPPPH